MIKMANRKLVSLNISKVFVAFLINPRKMMDITVLLKEVLEAKGEIRTPVMYAVPWLEDPAWVALLTEKGIDEAKWASMYVCVCGHNRSEVSRHIVGNPAKYSAEVVANASNIPAIVVTNTSLEDVRNLALDEQGRTDLQKWEIVQEVFRRYTCGHTYAQVARDMTHLLYKCFMTRQAKYADMLRITDVAKRNAQQSKDLRNHLDHHLKFAFDLGPAMRDAVIAHFMYNVGGFAVPEDTCVPVTADLRLMRKLKPIVTAVNADPDTTLEPIDVMDFKEKTDDAGNVTFEPYIVGGCKEVNEVLLAEMSAKRNGVIITDDTPKLPSKAERKTVTGQTRSAVGKAIVEFMNGESDDAKAEERVKLDENTLYLERRIEAVREAVDAGEFNTVVSSIFMVLTVGRNPVASVEALKAINGEINGLVSQLAKATEDLSAAQAELVSAQGEVAALKEAAKPARRSKAAK